ncbi:MAG: division/cell wall cluster transcriptional repressor MraZ [Nitrospinae bacterium CG11_big_fil_rev_8_21_14_0_20_56_8]|nr:MAG: division/cell wall cluster transcriptional repressor MraZ [Nitrospinae bacterium CG11_big_fil_rev_8_21_14_0_20_56_8]
MSGFLGTYNVSLDDKGRFNVPAKFRAVLEREYGSHLVVTAMSHYLIVFPQPEWEINRERLKGLDPFDKDDRDKKRKISSRAVECEIKSGKILIPGTHRDIADLDKEVVLVGSFESFEIWSRKKWDEIKDAE